MSAPSSPKLAPAKPAESKKGDKVWVASDKPTSNKTPRLSAKRSSVNSEDKHKKAAENKKQADDGKKKKASETVSKAKEIAAIAKLAVSETKGDAKDKKEEKKELKDDRFAKLGVGLFRVRSADETERSAIQDGYKLIEDLIIEQFCSPKARQNPKHGWVHFFADKQWNKKIPVPLQERLTKITTDICRNTGLYANFHILSMSIVYNPVGNSIPQRPHFDYHPHVAGIFIPMTTSTLDNSTQFYSDLVLPLACHEDKGYIKPEVMARIEQLGSPTLEAADDGVHKIQSITTVQTLFPPWSILQLNPRTIHRGMANLGPNAKDRILFVAHFTDEFFMLGESVEGTVGGCTVDCPPDCKIHY